MNISLTNSKLGDKIPSLNLPPILTCRADAPCKKGCYACHGTWLYSNVKNSLKNNLDEFMNDPNKFFNDIINALNGDIMYKYFRWMSSGDIVNETFLQGMIKVANETPQTRFLCFTKKFEIVNKYLDSNELPKNLKIVFSGWDKNFIVNNPHNLPMAYVYFKDTTRNADIDEYAIPCVGHCSECKGCWSLQNGQTVYFNQH